MRVTITVTAAQLTPYLGRGRKTGSVLVRELGLTSRGRPISHIYIYIYIYIARGSHAVTLSGVGTVYYGGLPRRQCWEQTYPANAVEIDD